MEAPAPEPQLETPILFIIFNRPQTTRRVFEEIRNIRPTKLFISADGPRADRPGEAALCEEARAIATNVDWPCEVKTLFQKENVGMKYGVASGYRWFFDQVEEGIILEDDDLPEPSFFYFAAEMLGRYRNNPRIMSICGTNVQHFNKKFRPRASYYFLSIPNTWGLATWRRAWELYDVEARQWPKMRDAKLLCKRMPPAAAFRFGRKFEWYWEGKIKSYDGQWVLACLAHQGLTIYPSRNLISNIGFGVDATGCKVSDPLWDSLPTESMPLPLIHPKGIQVDPDLDRYNYAAAYGIDRHWQDRAKWWLKSHFTGPYLFLKERYYKFFAPEKYAEFVRKDDRLFIC